MPAETQENIGQTPSHGATIKKEAKMRTPIPKSLSRTATHPIAVPRTQRAHIVRGLTSLPAGKMVPLHAFPLMREDAVSRLRLRASYEMMETVEILMNAVNVVMKAYLVPNLAFDRFNGSMDALNRSFSGEVDPGSGVVTPYFQMANHPAPGAHEVHEYMGKHVKQGTPYNIAYLEAYNKIWNFRAANRSPEIPQRAMGDATLAPAFWQHEQFSEIVPSFDQAMMDGEVPLTIVGGQLPVKSLPNMPVRLQFPHTAPGTPRNMVIPNGFNRLEVDGAAAGANMGVQFADISNVYAELASTVASVTLSNIELARKTQAFARLRERYSELTEEYLIDMLMDGLTIPDAAWAQPILLAEKATVFGMSKRYAADAANLTESVVNGMTYIDMNIRTPVCPMGGVVMIVAEVTPEQLFERQKDIYLHASSAEQMPHYLRDTLDPEKVEVVTNDYVDVAHTVPTGTFGYAPLHHWLNHNTPGIGGKFFRPTVNEEFDEERQRIWAVETVDPVLSADFYICNNMHTKPFVVTNVDPFEVVLRGEGVISGITVFGQRIMEDTSQYDEVMEEVDTGRIDQGTTTGRQNMDAPSLEPAAE